MAVGLREVFKFVSRGIKVILGCYLIIIRHVNRQDRKEQHIRALAQCLLKLLLQPGQLLGELGVKGVILCGRSHQVHV